MGWIMGSAREARKRPLSHTAIPGRNRVSPLALAQVVCEKCAIWWQIPAKAPECVLPKRYAPGSGCCCGVGEKDVDTRLAGRRPAKGEIAQRRAGCSERGRVAGHPVGGRRARP